MVAQSVLNSKDIVRRTIEEKDKLLISFCSHDGYFYVNDRELRKRIVQAELDGREISFTFNPSLKILSID